MHYRLKAGAVIALGALGLALKGTETVKTIEILLRGTWVPGSWT